MKVMVTNPAGIELQLDLPDLRNAVPQQDEPPKQVEWRPGVVCPSCGADRLDYDGLLNLSCPSCGYTLGGCFT